MNAGKAKYDAIPIPEELGETIDAGIRRAQRARRMRALRRTAAGAAAALAVLFAGANIMPVYSYASDVPVLGEIVRVLHIGSGGEITDGAVVDGDAAGGIVELSFSAGEGTFDGAPAYSVQHYYAPNRIVLNLHGVRGGDFEAIRESFISCEAVTDVYRNMYLDDSALSFTVVLEDGWDYELSERANPGALVFSFMRGGETGTVYYLRSEAMPYSEQLGLLCEDYHAEGASQVKTADGLYFVAIGSYGTEDEAEAALSKLVEAHGEQGFVVASGAAGETPEA